MPHRIYLREKKLDQIRQKKTVYCVPKLGDLHGRYVKISATFCNKGVEPDLTNEDCA